MREIVLSSLGIITTIWGIGLFKDIHRFLVLRHSI
jgi:hypothetical protein